MSELVLSTTQQNHYEYPTMVNINPELVNKSTNNNNRHENDNNNTHYTTTATTASTYPAYTFQSLPMGFTPVNSYPHHPTMSRMDYFDDPATATTTNTAGRQSNSPESISSSSSPTPSPPPASSSIPLAPIVAASQVIETELITTTASTQQAKFNNPTTARVKEMINRATSVPMEFYHTEFLEYSKESYEKKTGTKRNKRKRTDQPDTPPLNNKRKKAEIVSDDDLDEVEEAPQLNNNSHDISNMSDAEIRRQIHIQSEQKRRAQIKDGFDELRKHLPGCNNKKMSKAALLTRTVQQLQHLKCMQNELLSEVERLLQENESLKKFQHSVLQRQAMEKMYTF